MGTKEWGGQEKWLTWSYDEWVAGARKRLILGQGIWYGAGGDKERGRQGEKENVSGNGERAKRLARQSRIGRKGKSSRSTGRARGTRRDQRVRNTSTGSYFRCDTSLS